MVLRNLRIAGKSKQTDIFTRDGNIVDNGSVVKDSEPVLNFENAIAFPGLINSHDHLDFNLFPQLGNKKYSSYVEWGNDIHLRNKETINKIVQIPVHLRTRWGICKNLLNGFTTVVNHGEVLNPGNELITVFESCNVIHSVRFQKDWKWKLNRPRAKKMPVTIHIGEGLDKATLDEIDQLLKWNFWNRDIIGIHGVAMSGRQAAAFKGLVWCPDSNFFLLGETASIQNLKQFTRVVFGTDSTLTASWNAWDHLRSVRNRGFVTDEELYDMVTRSPAELWGLKNIGQIASGYYADMVIAKQGFPGFYDSFFNLNPDAILLVMKQGKIKLFDEVLLNQLKELQYPMGEYSKIYINKTCKYVYGDIPGLVNSIREYCPDVRLPVEIN